MAVPGGPASRSRVAEPRFPLLGRGFVLRAEIWPAFWNAERGCPLSPGRPVAVSPPCTRPRSALFPAPAPGAMASRGRKRKAETAVVVAAEKVEKLAGGQKEVEEATIVIEHW